MTMLQKVQANPTIQPPPGDVGFDHASRLFEAGTGLSSGLKVARWRVHGFETAERDAPSGCHLIDRHRIGSLLRSDRFDEAQPAQFPRLEPVRQPAVWKGDVPVEYTHFYLSAERLEALALAMTGQRPGDGVLRAAERVCDRDLTALLDCCEAALRRSGHVTALDLDTWFQVLGTHLVRLWARDKTLGLLEKPKPKRRQIKTALEMIETGLGEALSLEGLASACGMSAHTFSRHFKATVGKTVYQYVLERRIDRARRMLSETDEPIAAIAFEVGFSSQAHLTSAFRQRMGTTPRRFRSEHAAPVACLIPGAEA